MSGTNILLMKRSGFEKIDLDSKGIIDDFLSRRPLEASEYTFTNLFAFRMAYDFSISIYGDMLLILKDTDPVSIFCPLGLPGSPEVLTGMFDMLMERYPGLSMERVPEGFVRDYLAGNEDFIVEEERDQFDYLYDVRELSELRGRKYHDKRNKVNRFRSLYAYEYESLTPALIEECLAYEDYWCEKRECGKVPGLEKERCAILEILNNFESLSVRGGVIKIDNRIAALTLGEKITPDTFVVHIEKANPEVPGLYQVINQEFLMHEAADCTYVNREQDLGMEGLRRAKLSYNPVSFVRKYRIRRGQEGKGSI